MTNSSGSSTLGRAPVLKDGALQVSNNQNFKEGLSLKGDWSFYWKTFIGS